jgi:hypothetical protein
MTFLPYQLEVAPDATGWGFAQRLGWTHFNDQGAISLCELHRPRVWDGTPQGGESIANYNLVSGANAKTLYLPDGLQDGWFRAFLRRRE